MGKDLELVPVTIMQITFAKKRKGLISIRNMLIFGVVAFVGFTIWLFIGAGDTIAWLLTLIVAGFLFWESMWFNRHIPKETDIEDLSSVADKMETGLKPSHGRYLFFVKEEKWGVYDCVNFRVVVPAQYDSVFWKKKGKRLIATEGSKNYLIHVGKWNEKEECAI